MSVKDTSTSDLRLSSHSGVKLRGKIAKPSSGPCVDVEGVC